MPKVSRFIKLQVEWFRTMVHGTNPGAFYLCLLNDNVVFDYDDVWADISALECSFKGYARINVSSLLYNMPTEPTAGKWQAKSNPANFAYNSSAGSGLTSETAKAWALIVDISGTDYLLEYDDLGTEKLFEADGDEKPLEHFYNSLNCLE